MVLQLTVADVMTQPVLSGTPDTPLQQAVQLISDHHISGLPLVNGTGAQIGELSEQNLMVRESGVNPHQYVTLLDSVIYLRNPPQLGQAGPPGARGSPCAPSSALQLVPASLLQLGPASPARRRMYSP